MHFRHFFNFYHEQHFTSLLFGVVAIAVYVYGFKHRTKELMGKSKEKD